MAAPPTVDLTKYIETRIFGARPHIRGRRVPVATIAAFARANKWGIAELMVNFTLTESQVLAALLYYQEHKGELDQQELEESAQFEAAKRRYGDK
jgi:uncharacterized protein (DUF433 family)